MGESFELPLGVVHNGNVTKDIVLTPMTAKIRRLIANRANQKNPANGLTDVLGHCCESIAGRPPAPQLINALTVGDRDFMLLMLRKISLGDIIKAKMTCVSCQEDLAFDIGIDDIRIRRLELGKNFELDGDYPVVKIESDELGLKVTMRLPTGFDQGAISGQVKTDPIGASYAMYARLIKKWERNGKIDETARTVDFIDNLPLRDIEWLEEAVRKASPGPEWQVSLTCEVCGKRTPLDLSDTDFLFKTPR